MKKVALAAGLGLALIGLLLWLIPYLTIGRIIINTNNPINTITLVKSGENSTPTTTHGNLSLNLHAGEYIVTVQGNSVGSSQAFKLKAHHTQRYTINPINTTGVEPVTNENANSIVADGSRLLYVNAPVGTISQIDTQNNISPVAPDHAFRSVEWVNTSYGVGQDRFGLLYTIDSGIVKALNAPLKPDSNYQLGFIMASDKQIYISDGHDLYGGDPAAGFKKIYTAQNAHLSLLSASRRQVAFVDVVDRSNGINGASSSLVVVNDKGAAVKQNVGDTYGAAWSPSGNYLAVIGAGIFDKNLNNIQSLNDNVGSLAWLDDNTVLYSNADQLWSLSLKTGRADQIANMPFGRAVTSLVLSTERSYVYMIVQGSGDNNFEIKRVGLRGQAVPDFAYKLQSIMPLSVGECTLGLVNFGLPPTILVNKNVGSATQDCQQSGQNELQQDGFDTSKLRFVNAPAVVY